MTVRSVKDIFFRNYKVKISLFIVAGFLWFFIMVGGEYEAEFDIPLEIVGRRPAKVLVEEIPKTVKIQCVDTGKQLLLFQFFSRAAMRLDISTINYFYDYPINEAQIFLPGGFYPRRFNIISPDTVKIRLDDMETTRIPIQSKVSIVPKAGYVLVGNIELSEDSVLVRGARRIVRTLRTVETDPVTYKDISGELREQVALAIREQGVSYDLDKVEVRALVDRLGEIEIPQVPVYLEAVPNGRQVISEPPKITLKVRGAVSLLKGLREDSVQAVINFQRTWTSRQKMYTPQVGLPLGVELVSMSPEQVELKVIRRD